MTKTLKEHCKHEVLTTIHLVPPIQPHSSDNIFSNTMRNWPSVLVFYLERSAKRSQQRQQSFKHKTEAVCTGFGSFLVCALDWQSSIVCTGLESLLLCPVDSPSLPTATSTLCFSLHQCEAFPWPSVAILHSIPALLHVNLSSLQHLKDVPCYCDK